MTAIPQQVGVLLINGLPEDFQNLLSPSLFKIRLERFLLATWFYSGDQFTELIHAGDKKMSFKKD